MSLVIDFIRFSGKAQVRRDLVAKHKSGELRCLATALTYYIKVGFKGVFIAHTCYPDDLF